MDPLSAGLIGVVVYVGMLIFSPAKQEPQLAAPKLNKVTVTKLEVRDHDQK